jgi:lipoprotein-anchoring transpeptidase ErfK/SrfK
MNTIGKFLLAAVFSNILPILSVPAGAQEIQSTPTKQEDKQTADGLVLVVSVADKRMAVVDHGKVKKIYRVAVGRPSTPSPAGTFRVISRVSNPTYYHKGRVVPPGAGNPVGTRWIGLSEKGYGIHGTNAPSSIGKAASHGCIRMERLDLEELFAMLKTGESVEIVGKPNAETASLFGAAADAAAVTARATTLTTTQQVPQIIGLAVGRPAAAAIPAAGQ